MMAKLFDGKIIKQEGLTPNHKLSCHKMILP
jgi:hypothetical protein